MPVFCSKYCNMITLTMYSLMTGDASFLPKLLTPWGRVVYTARLGGYVAAAPIFIVIVMSFDIRSKRDWARTVCYSFLLQMSVLSGSFASLVPCEVLTSRICIATSLTTFLSVYILLAENYARYIAVDAAFKLMDRTDPSFLRQNLVRVGVSKAWYASLLCAVLLSFIFIIHAVAMVDMISPLAENILLAVAEAMTLLACVHVLTCEHITLILVITTTALCLC